MYFKYLVFERSEQQAIRTFKMKILSSGLIRPLHLLFLECRVKTPLQYC